MHAGRGLLRHALDLVAHLGEPTGAGFHALLDLRLDDGFFLGLGHGDDVFAGPPTGGL